MKKCVRRKVRKQKEIKGSDKYVTLEISSKFDSLDNIKTTSSDSKGKLETSGKGLVTSLGFKTKVRSRKYKKQCMPLEMSVRRTFQIISRSLRKLINCLMRRNFRLERQLVKCMIRSDKLNWHNHGSYTETTAPSSNVNATDEDESK